MALSCEMEIDHGGVQAGVSEILLDAPDVDAGFQEMSGVAVPECMDGNAFCKFKLFNDSSQSPLHRGIIHGFLGCRSLFSATSESGKDQFGVSMGCPVLAHDIQGGFRKRDIAVFSALSPVDMDAFSLSIDVGYLKEQGFMEPESAGINDSQIGFILDGIDCIDNGPYFFEAQDGRKCLVPFGIDELQGMPVVIEDICEKEFNAAVADSHSSGGPFIIVLSVEEIILEFLFGDFVRGSSVEIDQLTNRAGVAFLSAFAHSCKLQGSYGFLIVVFHHTFLLLILDLLDGDPIEKGMIKFEGFCNLSGMGFKWLIKEWFACRVAAYLNQSLKRIGHKAGLPLSFLLAN